MQLYIPSISDKITLTKNWTFPLYQESRNNNLIQRLRPGATFSWTAKTPSIMVTLEKGTTLRIDRIYIRKGKSEWDSITFAITHAPNDTKRKKGTPPTQSYARPKEAKIPTHDPNNIYRLKGARFWAKLTDVNQINCQKAEEE